MSTKPEALVTAATSSSSSLIATWTPRNVLLVFLFVSSGAANVLLGKACDAEKAIGLDGGLRKFHQPHLQTIMVIASQFALLGVFQVYRMYTRHRVPTRGTQLKHHPGVEAALKGAPLPHHDAGDHGAVEMNRVLLHDATTSSSSSPSSSSSSDAPMIVSDAHIRRVVRTSYRSIPKSSMVLPALASVIANAMAMSGLAVLFASLYQMLMGSGLLFIATLSVIWAKRKLRAPHWIGLSFVTAGVILAGCAGFFSGKTVHNADPAAGVPLVIGAQVLFATATVYRDRMFLRYKQAHPLLMAGYQGAWGVPILVVACTIGWFIPGPAYGGRYINILDGAVQIGNSPRLAMLMTFNFLSYCVFNATILYCTKVLSGIHMSMVNQLRTLCVWAVSFAIGWDTISYWQASGFIMMLIGNLVFNEIFKRRTKAVTLADAGEQRTVDMAIAGGSDATATFAPVPTPSQLLVHHAMMDAFDGTRNVNGSHVPLWDGQHSRSDHHHNDNDNGDDDEDDDEPADIQARSIDAIEAQYTIGSIRS